LTPKSKGRNWNISINTIKLGLITFPANLVTVTVFLGSFITIGRHILEINLKSALTLYLDLCLFLGRSSPFFGSPFFVQQA